MKCYFIRIKDTVTSGMQHFSAASRNLVLPTKFLLPTKFFFRNIFLFPTISDR